jgi:hypothetical protein
LLQKENSLFLLKDGAAKWFLIPLKRKKAVPERRKRILVPLIVQNQWNIG